MINTLVLTVLAYLLGSLPFGYLVSKFIYDLDIQRVGSGNIGATNVYRNLGWKAGLMTMAGDLGKGIVPVLIARSLDVDPRGLALVGLAAVIGHCFPVFLRFRGGKGVSVTIAVLLVLDPTICLVFVLLWLVILLALGQVAIASLGAAAGTTMLVRFLGLAYPGILLFTWAAAVIIFLRHHENVDRLMTGNEKELFSPAYPFSPSGK